MLKTVLEWKPIEEAHLDGRAYFLACRGFLTPVIGHYRKDETVGADKITGWFSAFGKPLEATHFAAIPYIPKEITKLHDDLCVKVG